MREPVTPSVCPGAKLERENAGYDAGKPPCTTPDSFTCEKIGRKVTACFIRDMVQVQPADETTL